MDTSRYGLSHRDQRREGQRTVVAGQGDRFGIGRALEPKGSMPQPAWRLDNDMEPRPDELLVEVRVICVNRVSFNEIVASADSRDEAVRRRILDIVRERGKLHNPVTGTGGMCLGRVVAMGSRYPNRYGVAPGDGVVSLVSLSATPLRIDAIRSIDYANAQLEVEGRCILFADAPLVRQPDDLPLKLVVAAMDEAGAPTRTYRTVRAGQDVLVLGAGGKIGLLCAYAARDRLGYTGRLVGLVKDEDERAALGAHRVFDELVAGDASDFLGLAPRARLADAFDVVIDCTSTPNTEMLGLVAVRDTGILYFASLSCDYKFAALTAESIGKDLTIVPYSGYLENHAEYALGLVRRYQGLREALVFEPLSLPSDAEAYGARTSPPEGTVPGLKDGALDGYIFASEASRATLRRALKVAQFNSSVVIYGESGVGKEIIAQIIHVHSERKSFPMIKINCAAIPENLLESELFGYEKGSFTGASQKGKMGLWEAAQGGTLFLDEVSELPLSLQAKLLRVIQEKEIVRVGGIAPIKVDVRLVAATNADLAELVARGRFREDLFYRLNVFPVVALPLRERRSDIVPLAQYFLDRYNAEFGMTKVLGRSARDYLSAQEFRGNIRELQNLVQRMMIIAEDVVIEAADISAASAYDLEGGARPTREAPPLREALPEEPLMCLDARFSEPAPAEPRPPTGLESAVDPAETLAELARSCAASGLGLKALLAKAEEAVLRECRRAHGSTRRMAQALGVSQPSVVRKLRQYGIGEGVDGDWYEP